MMMPPIKNRLGFTGSQTIVLVGIGIALWFLAAVILHLVAPMGAIEGASRAVTYALIIPGTLPFVWLTRILAKLRRDQIVVGVAVVTAAALLIDGVVVAWFPVVYGGALPQVTNCAAAILWGAGVGLLLAFMMNKGAET